MSLLKSYGWIWSKVSQMIRYETRNFGEDGVLISAQHSSVLKALTCSHHNKDKVLFNNTLIFDYENISSTRTHKSQLIRFWWMTFLHGGGLHST